MGRALRLGLVGIALALAVGMILVLGGLDGTTRFSTKDGAPSGDAPGTSFVVEMSPMGRVSFPAIPKRVVTLDAHYNELLVALGRGGDLLATGSAANFYDGFFAQLQGVDFAVDRSSLTYLLGESGSLFDKETLYGLGADVHHIDPLRLSNGRSWTRADVEEIARNVGPFFANRYSRTNDYPGEEPYEFYTLWDLHERVAEVYGEGARIRALRAISDAMVDRIQRDLPPENERPSVGLVIYSSGGFLPFSLSREGFGTAQYRAVGARDAFATIQGQTYADAGRGTRLDIEALLEIDPDVLIVPWSIYSNERYHELQGLKDDPLGQRLTAIHEGRAYPGGTPLQGPIFYLFQIEMAAKQIYPERFGAFRSDGLYPEPEQLFRRDEVAAIVRAPAAPSPR